jgi:hypothetical protein
MDNRQIKAVAVFWLNEMREKGRKRLSAIRREHANGQSDAEALQQAGQKQEAIEKLAAIINDWEYSLEELHDSIRKITADRRQGKLFQPKNPM